VNQAGRQLTSANRPFVFPSARSKLSHVKRDALD
jgi:hypothetical protein